MSAAELIEQIKALPPEDFAAVREFFLNGQSPAGEQPPVRYMKDEAFDAAAAHVFEVHAELLRKLAD